LLSYPEDVTALYVILTIISRTQAQDEFEQQQKISQM